MFDLAERVFPEPTPFWETLKAAGVRHVASLLRGGELGVRVLPEETAAVSTSIGVELARTNDSRWAWDYEELRLVRDLYHRAGLTLAVIEDFPPMDKIRLGLPGRDEEIEWFCTLLRNMGKLGIPVLGYTFMAVMGWHRTATAERERGGALVTGYDHSVLNAAPTTAAGVTTDEQMWSNFQYFLTRVVPVAEEAGVKLALHPDDPPISPIRGMARIMVSVDAFQRVIDMVPSPSNGILFCQGNFRLMTDDLPSTIRHFGEQGKIAFVHFRDVRGTTTHFVETFHDNGPTDMLACMRAYGDIGYEGVMRPDHVPTLAGEVNTTPGYADLAKLFALGYMRALKTVVESEMQSFARHSWEGDT
jgi:mannonate dehydratase